MFEIIIKSFYFILPAYFANMAPVIFDKLKLLNFLNFPIDGGRRIGKSFIFGNNKTWRGIVAAVIFGVLVSFVQAVLYKLDYFVTISIIDYSTYYLIFGFLAGLGTILGDLFKSFLKRRLGIVSGGSWPIFDQLDFVFGFIIFTYWLVLPSITIISIVFLLTIVLHPLINLISYFLGIKKVWW